MQPAPDKHVEVVYRRPPAPGSPTGSAERPRRGYAPAIAPLVIGLLLLLGLIVALGLKSANKMVGVGEFTRHRALDYSARLDLLLDLRLKFAQLNNEARTRHREESARELKPPFDVKLNKAREEAKAAMVLVNHPPLSETESWSTLYKDLEEYLKITEDRRRYGLEGYESFRKVDFELTNLYNAQLADRENVIKEVDFWQKEARRSINRWT